MQLSIHNIKLNALSDQVRIRLQAMFIIFKNDYFQLWFQYHSGYSISIPGKHIKAFSLHLKKISSILLIR